jgi:hypothetical protein
MKTTLNNAEAFPSVRISWVTAPNLVWNQSVSNYSNLNRIRKPRRNGKNMVMAPKI